MKYAHGQARHRLLATKNLIRDQAGQHDRGLGGVHSDLDPVQGVVHPGRSWPHQAAHCLLFGGDETVTLQNDGREAVQPH